MSSSALASQFDSIAFPLPSGAGHAARRSPARPAAPRQSVSCPGLPRQEAAVPVAASVAVADGAGMPARAAASLPVRQAGRVAGSLMGSLPGKPQKGIPLQASAQGALSSVHRAAAVSFRQKCTDVLLIAVWAALIPGFMWLGHYAGF